MTCYYSDNQLSLPVEMTGVTAALTIGPAVVGCMVASCFFGCSMLQTYTYYKRFPADRRIFQLLVRSLWLTFPIVESNFHIGSSRDVCVDTFILVSMSESSKGADICAYCLHHVLDVDLDRDRCREHNHILRPSRRQSHPDAHHQHLRSGRVAIDVHPVPFHMILQIFFTYRLFILSKSKTLATFCIILSILSLVGTFLVAVNAINYTAQNEAAQNWLTILTLVAATACDLVITIGLVYFLQRERKQIKVKQWAASSNWLSLV